MALITAPLNQKHPLLPNCDREVDITRIIISGDEVTLVLSVFYLENGVRVDNTTVNNPEFILRATPDSDIYRNAETGAIMPQDENNPLCIQEYELFMLMLQQPVKILEMATNIALEYEAYGRYDS
jgi:hypothetical protein